MDVHNRPFITKPDLSGPPDKFLPESTGPRRGGVDLDLKRALETNPVKGITKQLGKGCRGNKNLQGINTSHFKPADRPGRGFHVKHLHPVNLPGKSSAYKIFNDQADASPVPTDHPGHIIG